MFLNQLIKPYLIRSIADGKALFLTPHTPAEIIFRAFKSEEGPLFVVQQFEDGRLMVMRSPELPAEFMQPTTEIIGKLPTLLSNEYAPVDNLLKAVVTTQPVEEVSVWFDKFEEIVEGIAALTLASIVRHTLKAAKVETIKDGYRARPATTRERQVARDFAEQPVA